MITVCCPQAFQTLCAQHGRRKFSTRKTLHCATAMFCTRAWEHAGRRLACSVCGEQKTRKETTADSLLKTFFSTTGIHWCRWSRQIRPLRDFTFRNIWALDQPPLAGSSIAGDVGGVTFDNVKYGQARATGNADLPLAVSSGAQAAKFVQAPSPIAQFVVDPPFVQPRSACKLYGEGRTWRKIYMALRRRN